jgi:hypothetical protein
MKRSAAQYAVLSRLLDEVIPLAESARRDWLAALPDDRAEQRKALERMLGFDRALANRTMKRLETRLRSSARGVHTLCEQTARDG